MSKIPKAFSLVIYFFISFLFWETLLRVTTTGHFLSTGLFFTFIFSTLFSFILYIICTAFRGNGRFIFAVSSLAFLSFIFCSQFIYYKFFKTFYTIYSAGNAGQILEFWKDILAISFENFFGLILFFLPVILIIPIRKKIAASEKLNKSYMIVLCCSISILNLMGIAFIGIQKNKKDSIYNLCIKNGSTISSIEKLGLITSMELDIIRGIWSPSPSPISSAAVKANNKDVHKKEPPREVKTSYNTMNIDFSELISNEKNETIRDMHRYFQGISPTAINKYTGKYKGYNLILITAEAFSPYAVREDITPTLYKMVHEGFNFTNFYNPIWGVSTSDGEYVACTGLIPKKGVWSFYKSGSIYMPFAMGNQLKKIGYKTLAYHNHTYTFYKRHISHPNMGYEYKGVGNGLDIKKTWPESDLEMMEKTIPEYIENPPFHTYYMTVSGHLRYSFTGNSMSLKNKHYVDNLPYSEASKAYLACQIELDKALEYLIQKLEESGLAEKTLIALSADHYPYGLEKKEIDELAGYTVEENFELYKSTFILYTKGMTPVTIDKPCSSLDIIPTLSNLLGLEYDSRLLMGRDIFSDSEPLVIFQDKSFITDKGKYNSRTDKFVSDSGVSVDNEYIRNMLSVIDGKFYYSAKILENDYYSRVFNK